MIIPVALNQALSQ
jgi:hypothetical protein